MAWGSVSAAAVQSRIPDVFQTASAPSRQVRRKKDEGDRRRVLIQRTVRGSIFLREYGEIIAEAARRVDDP